MISDTVPNDHIQGHKGDQVTRYEELSQYRHFYTLETCIVAQLQSDCLSNLSCMENQILAETAVPVTSVPVK